MVTIQELRDDPVLFAQLILSLKLHEGQKKILNAKDRFLCVRAARRFGKSYLFSAYSAWYAATHPGSVIIVISKSQRQSSLMFQTISGMIRGSPLAHSIVRDTQTLLEFSNGSTIQALPGSSEEALRGFTINLVLVDEAAYVTDKLFTVLYPALTSVKGSMVLISTPGFSSGEFYRACQESSEFTRFHLTHKDAIFDDGTPLLDPTELEREAKRCGGYGSPEYKQEYLAEFTDAEGAFFQLGAIEAALDDEWEPIKYGKPERKYVCGLDVGMVNDFTVSIILDYTDPEHLQVVELQRYTGISIDEIAYRVGEQSQRFQLDKVLVDDGNAGKGVIHEIKTMYPKLRVYPFNFNRKSKPILLTQMSQVMNRQHISIPDQPEVLDELASLVYSENPETKHMKIAARGNGHDDIVMAIALAIEAAGIKKAGTFGGIASSRKQVGFGDTKYTSNKIALV